MIYVIKGSDPYLIRKKLNEIIKSYPDAEITRFNGNDSDFDIEKVINTCKTVNLFVEHNLILVKDPPLLCKKTNDKEAEFLLDYAKNPIFESELIFYSLENKISEKIKSTKDLIKNAELIKLDKLKKPEFYSYAKNMISQSKIKITKLASEYLVNNSNFDLSLLSKNIQVLSLYPEQIDENVITKLISLPDEEDPFNLINAISKKDINKSIEYINKLLKYDDNILGLIAMMANQLRFLYAVNYYDYQSMSDRDIMDTLDIKNDFRLSKARESLSYLNRKEILEILSKLSDLDYKCKTNSEIDDKTKLELLVVNLIK